MKAVYPTVFVPVVAVLCLIGPAAAAPGGVEFSADSGEVEIYDFVQLTIRVTDPDAANPFTDVSVRGEFQREDGAPVEVDGFCDSEDGRVYRIRFMPSQAGRYGYAVTYRQDGFERTHGGTFRAVASDGKGLLRVDPGFLAVLRLRGKASLFIRRTRFPGGSERGGALADVSAR